jgi:methionyl-tRNA formyltransferase
MTHTLINWHRSSSEIEAALPFGAVINGQFIAIARARAGGTMSAYRPGTITRCDEQVWVQCGQGHLVIETISVDGSEYAASDFCAKHALCAGDSFDDSHPRPAHGRAKEHKHAA